jgi:uncharacterized protein (DUF488 family)
MISLYTIGFTGKTAETFFRLLQEAGVHKIIDTRINNRSQLAGFAKGADLKFFAQSLCGIGYEQNTDFAPTKELLAQYRAKKMSWNEYETAYLNLLDMRRIAQKTDIERLHRNCLLCSEHSPEKCHRRLLAEYLRQVQTDVKIIHLVDRSI